MHTDEVRAKTFNIRFSDDEWERLDRLADFHGLNAAGLIRMLMKKEERALGEQAAPPKSPPKKSRGKK